MYKISTVSGVDKIFFAYDIATLFDDVKHASAFMCKNIVSKEGADLSEQFAITDDEEPMFNLCLSQVLPNIAGAFSDLATGEYKEKIQGSEIISTWAAQAWAGIESGHYYVGFEIQDNKAYAAIDPQLFDRALQSTIEDGVLSEFYTRVTHPELTKLSATIYANKLPLLAVRLTPMRKKSRL